MMPDDHNHTEPSYHDATPEAAEWAKDEGYLYTDCCGWVDHADVPTDVQALYDAEQAR